MVHAKWVKTGDWQRIGIVVWVDFLPEYKMADKIDGESIGIIISDDFPGIKSGSYTSKRLKEASVNKTEGFEHLSEERIKITFIGIGAVF